jgi:F-type H+-transporting ATPase subunit b
VASETAKREVVFGQRLSDQTTTAEGRIKAAKAEALNSVRTIAGDLAQAMTVKLVGAQPAAGAAAGAVDSVIKERA